jgi:hypothetical protein
MRPKVKISVPHGIHLPVSADLPGDSFPYWEKVWAVRGKRQSWPIISDRLLETECHYAHSTTVPCVRSLGLTCEFCATRKRMYLAFVAVWDGRDKAIKIACLTAGSIAECCELRDSGDLAGRELTIWRTGKSDRGPVHATLSDQPSFHVEPEKRIPPRELLRVLLNIWGIEIDRSRE